MAKILTGIQSTGTPHLGNILGAIIPAVEMANSSNEESYLFIANMHSLTQIKDQNILKENTFLTAATWLAFGLDSKKSCFFRQSDVPEVTELAWYLSCFFPYQRLKLAHSFKDKSDNLKDVNSGLFSYPMLMSADILMYDADIVPVGKDQLQHLEMTRDVASRFNNLMGDTFVVPEAKVQDDTKYIIGTDGEKMSKSKSNIIDIFLDDKKLRKQIMKIQTQSLSVEESKNPDQCNVFKLYKVIASEDQVKKLKSKYTKGGIGYGEAKELLYHEILNRFSINRQNFLELTNNRDKVEGLLLEGAIKARKQAQNVLKRVRSRVGY
ncbi:MAG: tryptophan--tRNA ligase [Cryomorphaceae bacterium]|jgi:tryptophanyl-tRNA synthetase|nr:tryptophan--tRNA ligase [Cryomorphaceae bacterium]MBT3685080.1 tryptophan--tRNA ligase [Cryomorphaceae bacterium]MBT4236809.1 tryptophan--tRNA ligase [Cryomorphaceae bacterium]MBT4813554.1 tryptophan--tRNA ligase [Cryomorphaceae bacterium]MBT5416709.1 tryptophan--tRNA ligase [Cryomorphaceae bacterium]